VETAGLTSLRHVWRVAALGAPPLGVGLRRGRLEQAREERAVGLPAARLSHVWPVSRRAWPLALRSLVEATLPAGATALRHAAAASTPCGVPGGADGLKGSGG
jgi:hypothetical protein